IAQIYDAISQNAQAIDHDAKAVLTNSGKIDIEANAAATAMQTAALTSAQYPGAAIALVTLATALGQSADASVGNANIELSNSGTLTLGVDAQAVANASEAAGHAGNAVASAFVTGGIIQTAFAADGNATAKLDNSGSLNISVVAKATGAQA